jgi:hypothetical protein
MPIAIEAVTLDEYYVWLRALLANC